MVISKAEEAEFSNKGWIATYVHKEYPKMVDGKIVNSHAEEERLIVYKRPVLAAPIDMSASADELFMGEDPPVIKETQIEGVDTAVIEKPKKSVGRPKKK